MVIAILTHLVPAVTTLPWACTRPRHFINQRECDLQDTLSVVPSGNVVHVCYCQPYASHLHLSVPLVVSLGTDLNLLVNVIGMSSGGPLVLVPCFNLCV